MTACFKLHGQILFLRKMSPPSLYMLIEAAKVLGVFVVLGFRAKVLWL